MITCRVISAGSFGERRVAGRKGARTSATRTVVRVGYSYDGEGNLVSQSDSNVTTSYSYDALNQLTEEKLR